MTTNGGSDGPAPAARPARADYMTPRAWIESLEVGGPYDIPAGVSVAGARTAAYKAEGKTFSVRKPSAFKPPVVYRTDDGARPAMPLQTARPKPMPSKRHRRRAPKPKPAPPPRQTVAARIMALTIGKSLSLATNEYGVRARAAIITKNTGRQFSVDETPGGKVLTRRG